jgi:hypothetical protein
MNLGKMTHELGSESLAFSCNSKQILTFLQHFLGLPQQ